MNNLILRPFSLAQKRKSGRQQFSNGEEDAKRQDQHADKDRIVFTRRDQDPHDIENTLALKKDHLVLELHRKSGS